MTFGCSPYSTQSSDMFGIVINITKGKEQRQLQMTVARSGAFFLKSLVWKVLLSFHHSANMLPAAFLKLILARWQSGQHSSL
jgi:hypothetical protein